MKNPRIYLGHIRAAIDDITAGHDPIDISDTTIWRYMDLAKLVSVAFSGTWIGLPM